VIERCLSAMIRATRSAVVSPVQTEKHVILEMVTGYRHLNSSL